MRRHPGVLRVVAADVHVHALPPRLAVPDAAPIIGREDHVALLQQVLVEAVINGVVPLHVPAVVVLIDAVTVDPYDGRMLLRSIEVSRHEEPSRYRLAVRPGIVHELGLDEHGGVDRVRHRFRETHTDSRRRIDRDQIGGAVRIGVLKNEMLVVRRPDRRGVCPPPAGDHRHPRVSGIAPDHGDAEVAIAGMIRLVRIERDPRAVMRPLRAPRFKAPLRNLNRGAASRRHDVDVIPSVAIADEGNPLAVGRRLRVRIGSAGDAPEFRVELLVHCLRFGAGDIEDGNRTPLVIARLAIDEDVAGVQPPASTESAQDAERPWRAATRRNGARLARHVLGDRVDDFRSRVGGCLLMADRRHRVVEKERLAVGRPAHAPDRMIIGAQHERLAAVRERPNDELGARASAAAAAATAGGRFSRRRRTGDGAHERHARAVG